MALKFIKSPRSDLYSVQFDGVVVGHMKAERMGWNQIHAPRGTPSQSWRFVAFVEPFKSIFHMPYLKDIKAEIQGQLNGASNV